MLEAHNKTYQKTFNLKPRTSSKDEILSIEIGAGNHCKTALYTEILINNKGITTR